MCLRNTVMTARAASKCAWHTRAVEPHEARWLAIPLAMRVGEPDEWVDNRTHDLSRIRSRHLAKKGRALGWWME